MRVLLTLCALVLLQIQCKHLEEKTVPKATPVDRKVMGMGQPYRGQASLDKDELLKSMQYRREKAWDIVKSIVIEVPIAQGADLGGFKPIGRKTLPLWQTWYDQAEFREVFNMTYDLAGRDVRIAQQDFCPDALESALRNHASKNLHIRYRGDRFEKRLAQFENLEQIRGISGRGVTLFSPAIILHYLMNYQIAGRCQLERLAFSRESAPPSNRNFAPCLRSEFPTRGAWAQQLDLMNFNHCPPQQFSLPQLAMKLEEDAGVAAAIKTSWTRVEPGQDIGYFAMDPANLERAFNQGEWTPTGTKPSTELSPDQIYTIETIPDAATDPRHRYQLTALHIVTKDVRDWMWITLIWSPDAKTDLGADRPAWLAQNKPWNNYKLCVVSAYDEGDAQPGLSYLGDSPDLAASLGKFHSLAGGHSLCNNPYIERGKGNSRTNCIGCHQHARTGVGQEEIYLDDPSDPENSARRAKYPADSRAKVRENFPSDYLWSFFEDDIKGIVESYKMQDDSN